MPEITYHFWVGEGEQKKEWVVQYEVSPGPNEGETRLQKVPGSERPCICSPPNNAATGQLEGKKAHS